MLAPSIQKNDKKAGILIIILSAVVFLAVAALSRIELKVELGFDKHVFAKINAFINGTVSVLLLAGLMAVKAKKFVLHKRIMLSAMVLSALFLVSYIIHHLITGSTTYGGGMRLLYFVVLISHIFLAAIILPFILYTVYRGLTAEFSRHKKIARLTWPIWFYVSVTGVVVYLMISPYYQ